MTSDFTEDGEGSGLQSGDPQSSRMRTSSIWSKYARGPEQDERAAPDKGVNVIIAAHSPKERWLRCEVSQAQAYVVLKCCGVPICNTIGNVVHVWL